MKTYLIHHLPSSAAQDTWAVSFSLPYIASRYARARDGMWFVQSWLTADQIKRRLAVLFDDSDQLLIHELGRDAASMNAKLNWIEGRLDADDASTDVIIPTPRSAWNALQSVIRRTGSVERSDGDGKAAKNSLAA